MARNRKAQPRSVERPQISLLPALPMTAATVVGGLAVLAFGLFAVPRDGWSGLIWALPGIYIAAQPIQGIVRGQGEKLRMGWRTIDLAGLESVTVHDRKNFGLKYSVASLKFADHVEEITGMFLSTKSLTELVTWLDAPIKVVDGMWSARRFWAAHPRLMPSRPAKTAVTRKPRSKR